MKRISTILSLFSAIALFAMPGAAGAQTLTLNSVSATQFCAGDPFSVTITATGTWEHNNAFTVQLSDSGGGFNNVFTNLGSVKDTAPGTFTISSSMPSNVGTHYRLRVMGAYPYIVSADNGTDITIAGVPGAEMHLSTNVALEGDTIIFTAASNGTGNSYSWDFGSGANPATSTDSSAAVWYSTSGTKPVHLTVTSPFGCASTISNSTSGTGVYVFSCNPAIPSNAYIDSTNYPPSWVNIWVVPGAATNGYVEHATIFAEPGSSIGGGIDNVVYLKDGAAYSGGLSNTVIYSPGASVNKSGSQSCTFLPCSSLSFDYHNAPPNSIMHINDGSAGVATPSAPLALIEVSPNPTNGIVAMQGAPANAQVQVMNVLGVAVREIPKITESNFTLDLSTLPAGTYYIRIASNNGVVTKKIVKE
jgi:PKD repeat protein